jgi:peptidoglycan/LPS O-acetylase OafA/YrhL
MPHLRALDGLRGFAVLAVVMYHFAPGLAPGGFLGVDIFFVLSGFLITSLLVNELEGTRRIRLPTFWARRARRLLPALLLVLAAVALWALFVANPVDAQHAADDGLSAFTYVANWHFISSGQSYIQQFVSQAPSPLRHMWSLAIEEQFYVVWPLVVAAIGALAIDRRNRPGRGRRRLRPALVTVCVVVGTASFVRMVTLYHPGGDPNRVYYGTDTRAYILLFGAALGALTAGVPTLVRQRARSRIVRIGCFAALALVGTMAWVATSSSWLYEGGYGVLVAAMLLVLVAAAQPGPNPLARIFEARALVGLGVISYGVYLWHWPATVWLTPQSTGVDGPALFALRAAVTLVASLASYWLVEQPIRRGKMPQVHVANPGVAPMAAVTVVAVLLLVPAVLFPSANSVPGVSTSKISEAVTVTYERAPRCDGPLPAGALGASRPITIELVGNSLAKEIATCFGKVATARGDRLEQVAQNGVPFCDLIQGVRGQVSHTPTRPDVAVLLAFPNDRNGQQSCPAKSNWLASTRELIRIWTRAGVHVYLAPSVPSPGATDAVKTIPVGKISYPATFHAYQQLAQRDPSHVTLIDTGSFLRDAHGVYQWRMPCLQSGEKGCGSDHRVPVRNPTDRFHFCADGTWAGGVCPQDLAAGERRASAAVALTLFPRATLHP